MLGILGTMSHVLALTYDSMDMSLCCLLPLDPGE